MPNAFLRPAQPPIRLSAEYTIRTLSGQDQTGCRSSAAAPARADVYTRVTNRIIADLENGVRPWLKPWNADNMVGRNTRPLHSNGQPCGGINVLMLWARRSPRATQSGALITARRHSGRERADLSPCANGLCALAVANRLRISVL
jgi:N-terminal domain of anti-restriction factor ArdC